MFQVYLTVSGSGKIMNIFEPVASLDACTEVVQRAEQEFDKWLEAGDVKNKPTGALAWLNGYEGCDIYAKNLETGAIYEETGHGEEEIGWEEI